ncbi:sigma-70 family RNA polymerase sigma factor [bacterium SCSIO 12741]|nr:sigma-70 family RNA polymerase sigma factor [bacterium SCSIO 12741]
MSKEDKIRAKLIQGDSRVFAYLYREYYTMVQYLVTQNSGDDAAAQDLFQEVMVVLYEKARDEKLHLTATIKTFIYSIARNLWLKELRKRKSELNFKDYERYLEEEQTDDEEEEVEGLQQKLDACLEKLGDPCKTLLIRFYYFKKSVKELAKELKYANPETVKAQKYKCMKRLRSLAAGTL